jgi:hypothetical protein
MRLHRSQVCRFVTLILVLLPLNSTSVLGQETGPTRQARDTGVRTRQIPRGQKAKVKGLIVRRDADTFSVADEVSGETVVLLTDRTSVK